MAMLSKPKPIKKIKVCVQYDDGEIDTFVLPTSDIKNLYKLEFNMAVNECISFILHKYAEAEKEA